MKSGPNKKGLITLASFFEEMLFSEEFSKRKGFMQSLAPSSKLIFLVFAVVAISFSRDLMFLCAITAMAFILAVISRIPPGYFILRSIIFIPIFSLFIALPAVFNIFVPGDPLVILLKIGKNKSFGPINLPAEISITKQGVHSALVFVMRVLSSVSIVVVTRLTTDFDSIMRALGKLVPGFISFTIGMSYRYLKLLLDGIRETNLAMTARSPGENPSSFRKSLSVQGAALLKRSIFTAEKIFDGMKARGFEGEIKTYNKGNLGFKDFMLILTGGFVLALVLAWSVLK